MRVRCVHTRTKKYLRILALNLNMCGVGERGEKACRGSGHILTVASYKHSHHTNTSIKTGVVMYRGSYSLMRGIIKEQIKWKENTEKGISNLSGK